jgi:dTMP kinase
MIVGLEGVSCVGKTSLATALAARLPGAAIVDCYYHTAPDPGRLPQPNSPTAYEQLSNLLMLMQLEALRRDRALHAQRRGHLVILDRTVDTLLAHAHAIGRLRGFDCDAAARALVLEHPIVVPDVTLLLRAGPDVLAKRAARRPGMPSILYDPEFTEHFNSYFQGPLAPLCVPLDATAPLHDLAEQATAAVGQAQPAAFALNGHGSTGSPR